MGEEKHLPKVLVVEDEKGAQEWNQIRLKGVADVEIIGSQQELKAWHNSYMADEKNRPDYAAMIFDFDLGVDSFFDPGEEDNKLKYQDTTWAVKELRAAGYEGPIVAASGHHKSNAMLKAAGCSHEVKCGDKYDAALIVKEILSCGIEKPIPRENGAAFIRGWSCLNPPSCDKG